MINDWTDFFEDIIILNLERSSERKEKMEKEFEKAGIKKYRFFKGIDYTDPIIQKIREDGTINKSFFLCVRCHKKRCGCLLPKNGFLDTELANWLSFVKIMEDIYEKGLKNALIFEDDIEFMKNGVSNLNTFFKSNFISKYNINIEKPYLLRLGTGYNKAWFEMNNQPFLKKELTMANRCFCVNRQYIELFLSYWKPIVCTSDMFIHKVLNEKTKGQIQDWTLFPVPIYDISWGPKKKINSLIRDVKI